MEYLDKIIPLAILGLAAASLIVLVRRVAREKEPAVRVEEPPVPVEVAPIVETPAIVVAVEPIAMEPVVVAPPVVVPTEARAKRPSLKKVIPPFVVKPTPIQTVLGLLKENDSLAAAFVLHEILGPPRSRRKKIQ
jgi:hypothetical protein